MKMIKCISEYELNLFVFLRDDLLLRKNLTLGLLHVIILFETVFTIQKMLAWFLDDFSGFIFTMQAKQLINCDGTEFFISYVSHLS